MTQEINWDQVLGNPYRVPISPEMLSDDGLKLRKTTGIKGGSKVKEDHQVYTVVYNRDYVVKKLSNELRNLKSLKWNEVVTLVSDAWKKCKLD